MHAKIVEQSHESSADMKLHHIFQKQRDAAFRYPIFTIEERRLHLKNLQRLLLDNVDAICEAINKDFGHRSKHETKLLEIFPSLIEIKHALKNIKKWMRPERKRVSFYFWMGRARVIKQPLGVVGIIVPWNYPLYLSMGPITSALAAGNRVMIKMSEYSPHFGQLLAHLLEQYFADDHVAIINGDVNIATEFSKMSFDLMLFTGSGAVGKKVMKAASDNLTPVILELGGKSPAIIAQDYPIHAAVKRIVLGKCFNAGQTCIAPDYVMLHEAQLPEFIELARKEVINLYPDFLQNNDYSLIINDQHYLRLQSYLQDAEAKGAELYPLAPSTCASKRRIPPTLVSHVNDRMMIMQEEIFGPILPIVCYRTLEEAISYVNRHPKPLALYYFDFNKTRCDQVLHSTQAGGVTVNDVLCHISQDELPFGGVGPSGMGSYHGVEGFNAFSKRKGVFFQSRLNAVSWLKPPFKKRVEAILKLLIR